MTTRSHIVALEPMAILYLFLTPAPPVIDLNSSLLQHWRHMYVYLRHSLALRFL